MRILKLTVGVIITAVLFMFVACNTTEEDPSSPSGGSYFTYDGTTYTLDGAMIEDWGANTEPGESGYNLNFSVFTPGPGTVSSVFLDLNSPTSTLAPGPYTWSATRTDFTIFVAAVFLNYDFATNAGTIVTTSSGTVTVSVDGGTYTVEFTLDAGGKTVTGRYSGPARAPP